MTALTKRGTPRKRNYPEGRNSASTPLYDRILRYAVEGPGGCWLWTAHLVQGSGYGSIQLGTRRHNAHRVAYEAFIGEIPEGLHLDHLCRVRRCVNPWHLEPVTPLVNTRRGEARGVRVTACPNGHPYDETNTYRPPGAPNPNGRRMCRTCNIARIRLWRAMTPEERAARKAAGLPVVDLAAYFTEQRQEAAA